MMSQELKNVLPGIVRKRLWRQNKNWLCVITGETGSGKSFSALELGIEIDKNFGIDNVVFTPESFMELLISGKMKRGGCVVFDECGVGIPAREWYSLQNKILSYVLQTFRRDNIAVIFTVPSISFIDSQVRSLFHAHIETRKIDREKQVVKAKVFKLQTSATSNKLYRKYPRLQLANNMVVRLNPYYIKKPPKKIIGQYERKKKIFSEDLKVSALYSIKKIQEKIKPVLPTHRCVQCGHKWSYTGTSIRMRCPSCGRTIVERLNVK